MSFWQRLFGRGDQARTALEPLWQRLVALARDPEWYANGGVADTMAGRFDMVSLVTALTLLRLEKDPALVTEPARLTEQFVADMEGQLREQGIGDPTLGKRVGQLVSTLGGRLGALRAALAQSSDAALIEMLERNLSFGDSPAPEIVAAKLRHLAGALDRSASGAILAGEFGQ